MYVRTFIYCEASLSNLTGHNEFNCRHSEFSADITYFQDGALIQSLFSTSPPNINFFRTAPGGILIQEGSENACQTETCLFGQAIDSMEMVKAWEQVFVRLVRR